MNKRNLIAIGILMIILVISCIVRFNPNNSKHNVTSANSETLPTQAIVILTKNGFSPRQVTIKVDSSVRWINQSGKRQTVNSDNYPTNQLYKPLNLGIFANGSSVSYIFKTPGTYGYHNQFNHTQVGKITVVQ